MNSVDSAGLLAQASETVDNGFLALFIVQLMGVLIALGLTFNLHKVYGDAFSESWCKAIQGTVMFVVILTLIVALGQKEFLSRIWGSFQFTPPSPDTIILVKISVKQALCIYFLADFAALAVLIYGTGGSEQSLFSTFLFVLVPITIALGRQPGSTLVILFAGITIGIFLALLWKHARLDPSSVVSDKSRRYWFGSITTMCVIFPTIVYCLQN